MGIRFTLCRSVVQRLCGGRAIGALQPAAQGAAGAGRLGAAFVPRLAVRAGVDAGAHEEPSPPTEGAMAGKVGAPAAAEGEQQRPPKRAKRDKERKPPPPRPNYFLALQVSQHPEICAAISQVHACLSQHAPHLEKACVEPASAHLTLGVMALPGEADQARARELLAALAAPLAQAALLQPVAVRLEGLSHFRNQVLYLDVRQDAGLERLLALAAAARAHFQEAGLLLEADRPFVPHVTVAKTSKLQGGRWGKGRGGGGGRHGRGGRGRHGHQHERGWRQERRNKEEGLQRSLAEAADALMEGAAGSLEEQGEVAAAAAAAAPKTAEAATPALAEAALGSAAELPPGSSAPASAPAAAGDAGESSGSGGASAAAAGTSAASQLLPGDPADAGNGDEGQGQREQQPQQAQRHDEPAAPGWRQIPAEAWAPHAAIMGGAAVLTEVQLCAMQGRRPGEYYPVLCSLPLSPSPALASSGSGGGSAGGSGESSAGGSPDGTPVGVGSGAAAGMAEQAQDAAT